jgi:hypothetical protein
MELKSNLEGSEKANALRGAIVIYLVVVDCFAKFMTGRLSAQCESENIPCVLPLSISVKSVENFVKHVLLLQPRIIAVNRNAFASKVRE